MLPDKIVYFVNTGLSMQAGVPFLLSQTAICFANVAVYILLRNCFQCSRRRFLTIRSANQVIEIFCARTILALLGPGGKIAANLSNSFSSLLYAASSCTFAPHAHFTFVPRMVCTHCGRKQASDSPCAPSSKLVIIFFPT